MPPPRSATLGTRISWSYIEQLNPQREGLPQIYAAHFRVARQSLRTTRPEDPALVNNVRPVGHRQCFTDVVIRNQNADPGALQIENDALQFQHLNRIDAAEGLVQQ